jgi:twitching motility protein PilT
VLKKWVKQARNKGASDLHLEPGLAIAVRVRGELLRLDEVATAETLLGVARELVPPAHWSELLARRSYDLSRVIAGTHCRINIMQTARGLGLAVRLLSSVRPTIEGLNLHPDLRDLALAPHGLILVSGPTGSGKSSTMAALVETINETRAAHIITVEEPIEYHLTPRRSLIRQREVGRDTPSFAQALLDALREDPDVIMVGEMRRHETMQLTLDAAETGHLVLATLHSSSVAEAVQRLVSSFPPGAQEAVRVQLSQSLVAVISQRLVYRPAVGLRVPECQVLRGTSPVRAIIRQGQMHKLESVLTTGREDGMWSWDRYRRWLDAKTHWKRPSGSAEPLTEAPVAGVAPGTELPPMRRVPAPASAPPTTSQPVPPVFEVDPSLSIDTLIAEIRGR